MRTHASPPAGTTTEDAQVRQALGQALSLLRAQGRRVTTARRAVIETLARLGGHPSAAELAAQVEARHPGVHLATVYRTLEVLTDLGVVTHVHMGHGATAYHLAGSDDAREHLHARCTGCGRVVDLPADLLDPVRDRLAAEAGFRLDARHVALSGRCSTCRGRSAGALSSSRPPG